MSVRQRPTVRVPIPEPESDETVRIRPPSPAKPQPLLANRRAWLAGAGILGTACLLGGVGSLLLLPRRATPPAAPTASQAPAAPSVAIQTAGEQEILHNVPTGLTVFRFADDQRILVLDFASLEQQGLMLNRVAALVEKSGAPRTRVLDDVELTQAIRAGGDTVATYYYGHDYSAASLQRFFDSADAEHVPLDPQEQALRALLHQIGWFAPGTQAGLISIPAVGANAAVTLSARAAILHHELSHGLFFSDADYAGFVHDFWNTALTGDERGGVRQFLRTEGYDIAYEELMYNEMQAYLMFTRDPEFFAPGRVGMTPQRLAALQTQFLRGMPTGWLHDALAATPVALTEAATPG